MTVIDKDYRVLLSEGEHALPLKQLTAEEFTDFLVWSKYKHSAFHHDILYNPEGQFWLVVSFPASIRIDCAFILNTKAAAGDLGRAALILGSALGAYLLVVLTFTGLYSTVTAAQITGPLRRLSEGSAAFAGRRLRGAVDLNLKNEFAELAHTFNGMALESNRKSPCGEIRRG